jgi:segregation and condensation protein A
MSTSPPPDAAGGGPSLEDVAYLGPDGTLPCAIKVDVFEGPLDLLLHLIRENEVDVHDIPISAIATQYIEYLALMRELNLDVAGEYLLMAATLAWIKSRFLLPPAEGEEEDEGGDPRLALVARLLEYQRYREVAEALGARPILGREVFDASAAGPEPVPENERELEVDLFQLVKAFKDVLHRARPESAPHQVESEPVTVLECMRGVMKQLESHSVRAFDELFDAPDGAAPSRSRLVATFLAILELARLAAVRLYPGAAESGVPTGPVQVRLAQNGQATWTERVSEVT